MYDVIIVGGGPAGLSAAAILGRCRRSVLLCDDGQYRNDASLALHGFLSRDGIHPAELRRISREQIERYEVECRAVRVTGAHPSEGGFSVTLEDGSTAACRKLLLATGIRDTVPEAEGFQTFFGRGVFHSPYCDGWEVRDRRLAAYGTGKSGAELARGLKTWSPDVVLCTDGPSGLKPADSADLAGRGIHVLTAKVARLEGSESGLDRIIFADGSDLPVAAVFLSPGRSPRSDLASRLGYRPTGKGVKRESGVYVAGDAARDAHLAILAAAEGAQVAMAINRALQQQRPE
jgi:thioredoxin reductase